MQSFVQGLVIDRKLQLSACAPTGGDPGWGAAALRNPARNGKGRLMKSGQRWSGAAVADCQVRGAVPEALRDGASAAGGAGGLLRLLQRAEASPGPGLAGAGRRLPASVVGGLSAWACFFLP